MGDFFAPALFILLVIIGSNVRKAEERLERIERHLGIVHTETEK